ncbi:hypothetical protein [Bradyrhizobium sp.]|uniref:hypothetical protein n=1 Tax=Bradyrhizobium sp. TaxID=376 RepID=UPI002D1FADEB|nr:hypothetical protein [Bradyrhizobium sp.]
MLDISRQANEFNSFIATIKLLDRLHDKVIAVDVESARTFVEIVRGAQSVLAAEAAQAMARSSRRSESCRHQSVHAGRLRRRCRRR